MHCTYLCRNYSGPFNARIAAEAKNADAGWWIPDSAATTYSGDLSHFTGKEVLRAFPVEP